MEFSWPLSNLFVHIKSFLSNHNRSTDRSTVKNKTSADWPRSSSLFRFDNFSSSPWLNISNDIHFIFNINIRILRSRETPLNLRLFKAWICSFAVPRRSHLGAKMVDALIFSLQKFFLFIRSFEALYIENSLGQKPQNAHSWVTICSVSALEFSKLSKVTFFSIQLRDFIHVMITRLE